MCTVSNGSVSAPDHHVHHLGVAHARAPALRRRSSTPRGSCSRRRRATATSASPSRMYCAADTIACRPLPHRRLTRQRARFLRQAAVDARRRARCTCPWARCGSRCRARTGRRPSGPPSRVRRLRVTTLAASSLGRDVLQAAAVIADGRAHAAQDDDFSFAHGVLRKGIHDTSFGVRPLLPVNKGPVAVAIVPAQDWPMRKRPMAYAIAALATGLFAVPLIAAAAGDEVAAQSRDRQPARRPHAACHARGAGRLGFAALAGVEPADGHAHGRGAPSSRSCWALLPPLSERGAGAPPSRAARRAAALRLRRSRRAHARRPRRHCSTASRRLRRQLPHQPDAKIDPTLPSARGRRLPDRSARRADRHPERVVGDMNRISRDFKTPFDALQVGMDCCTPALCAAWASRKAARWPTFPRRCRRCLDGTGLGLFGSLAIASDRVRDPPDRIRGRHADAKSRGAASPRTRCCRRGACTPKQFDLMERTPYLARKMGSALLFGWRRR